MKKLNLGLVTLLATSLLTTLPASAADEMAINDTKETAPFSGGAEANVNLSTGNTDIKTFGASAFMDYRAEVLNTRVKAGYMQNNTDHIQRARRIDGSVRTGLNITNNVDFFGLGTYMQNPFKGINSQVLVTPGIGLYAINTPEISIRAEGGVGYMWETYNPSLITNRSFITGTAGAGMRFKLSDVADLSDDFAYIAPLNKTEDWRMNNVAALTTALSKHFALKVAYTVEHRHLPVFFRVQNDTFTTASLVFKL